MKGPPDLCIEILSPSSIEVDRLDKFDQYAAGGVAYYWIVDPVERTIEGYKLSRGKYRRVGPVRRSGIVRLPPFEDLDIAIEELWQPET